MNTSVDPVKPYLNAWFSQRPAFALMGEYSAGKSTLLNLLLGEQMLPTRVTATNMPVIWMTYGETPAGQALSRDGVLRDYALDDLGNHGMEDNLLLRLTLPAEILRKSDIIDTPGISDARLKDGALSFIAPYLDFVVWCSAANQAWRQTEKAMWTSMPKGLRDVSIMTLTRADMMRKPGDLDKVVKRCQTDAAGLFRDFVPLATTKAVAALDDRESRDGRIAWQDSFAPRFFDALDIALASATQACDARDVIAAPEVVTLPEPEKATTAAPENDKIAAPETVESDPVATVEDVPEATATPEITALTQGLADNADCVNFMADLRKIRNNTPENSKNDQLKSLVNHFSDTILVENKTSDEHRAVLDRALAFRGSENLNQLRVVTQIVTGFEDFANDPWCRLDQTH